MSERMRSCDICGVDNPCMEYEDFVCSSCGSEHYHTEATIVNLSERQRKALLETINQWRSVKPEPKNLRGNKMNDKMRDALRMYFLLNDLKFCRGLGEAELSFHEVGGLANKHGWDNVEPLEPWLAKFTEEMFYSESTKPKLKPFCVQFQWTMGGEIKINAESSEQARELVEALPFDNLDSDYIDGSFGINSVEML